MGKKFDYEYIVIGSGPAGSAAAFMAAEAGVKTAIVEADKWGGTNLNYRDVPAKTALSFSHSYARAIENAKTGLSSVNLRYNYPTAVNWQNTVIRKAGGNSKKDFEEAGITCLHGYAQFVSPTEITVGSQTIRGGRFLLATGAHLDTNGISGIEKVQCLTPDQAYSLNRLPRAVMVVGGGSTGCEIAQYYAELGVKVLIAEIAGRLLPHEDEEVGQVMDQFFNKKLGIKVLTESRVIGVEQDAVSKRVVFLRDGQEKAVRVDAIVLATGSRPNLDLGLDKAGIKVDRYGLVVDRTLQTSARHIWAAGDILGGDSSTEKAAYEGALAAANLLNRSRNSVNHTGFVRVTDTFPQIATVGVTEDDCLKRDHKFKKVVVSLSTVMVSNIEDFKGGFVKLLADRQGKILGATVMAPNADLIIQEIALAMRHDLTVVEIASTPHVASSWSDIIKVAARKLAKTIK